MKKILWGLMLPVLTLMMLSSCEKDTDSNPTFHENTTGFVLNMPAVAPNNTIDLLATTNLIFTTNQPDYGGIPLRTSYDLQFSLDGDAAEPKYISLGEYTTTKIEVAGRKFNDKVVEAWTEAAGEGSVYPSGEVKEVSVRLHANVAGVEIGSCYSNVIKLNVVATYKAPDIQLPEELLFCGSFIGDAWKTWTPLHIVYGLDGNHFLTMYVPEGGEFKWGTYAEQWLGYADFKSYDDQAGAGLSDNGGNIKVANAGWYSFAVKAKINGEKIDYTMTVYPAKLYIIGNATGSWTDSDAALALSAPADNTGVWESPAFAGGGEMRAYCKIGDFDWWRTEFTLFKGKLFWREVNLPDSWKADLGADYSVSPEAGQKLYVTIGATTDDFVEAGEVR